MRREFSAGGIVVRRLDRAWRAAVIRPAGKDLWALPKGIIDPGERAPDTAVREVREETGVEARLVEKLGDVRYVYTWDGERVFKVVSFFLLRYSSGRLGDLSPAMRIEVSDARWVPLDELPTTLAYSGERQMAALAVEKIRGDLL
jgi:8-oxo-dGTP pyrophosphatase MutT (NUDIX family)